MLANNPHQIIRQVLELELSHTDQAFELQETVVRLFQGQCRNVMESVFDQIAEPEEWVRVERLEIDLGMLRGSDWMTQFSQRLATQLQSNLEQILHSSAQTTPDSCIHGSKQDGLFQQFLCFCEYGRLPWWGHKPSDDWLDTLQSEMTLTYWQTLAQLLSQDARALRRLIYTVSDEFLQTMLQILKDLPDSATVLRLLVPGDLPYPVQSLWRERFWLTVLPYCISPTAVSMEGSKLMQHLLAERQTLLPTDDSHSPEMGLFPTSSANIDTTAPRSPPPTPLPSHETLQSGNTTAINPRSPLPQPWQNWLEQSPSYPSTDIPTVMPLSDGGAEAYTQLLYFCQSGSLPEQGHEPSAQWLETLPSVMTPAQWQTLAQLVSQDARALRRLVYTASDEFLQTMLQILKDLPESATVLRLLLPGELPHPVQSLWRERFWLTVLPYCISPTAVSMDSSKLMQHLLTERQILLQTLDSTHTAETALSPTDSENREGIELQSPLPQPWQTWLEQSPPSPVTDTPTLMPLADVSAEAYTQLLYFCQYGSLPGQRHELSSQWLETLPSAMTLTQWQTLAQLLSQDARALRRLIYTVSDEFLQTMLQILKDLPDSATVLRLLVPRDLPYPVQSLWRERFWLTVLPYCISPTAVSMEGSKLMQHLLAERQTLLPTINGTDTAETALSPTDSENRAVTDPRSPPPTPLPSPAIPQSGNTTAINLRSPLPQPWQTWLESFLLSQIINTSTVMPLTNVAVAVDAQWTTSQSLPILPETEAMQAITGAEEPTVDSTIHPPMPSVARSASPCQPSISQTPQRSSAIETSKSKAVYIGGSGIVIVHPFLQELFQSLELLEDNQFRDVQTRRQAVALLTYLTYGEANIPEYELLLPKLLCAWPWEEPLTPYKLDEAERNTCEELLGAVLKHWSALRSSSTEWLRQQFFWRDGKLKPVDLGWQLTIEHRMQDVLLSKLPWGIGVIHLPWMTNFLHVNWME